MACIRALKLAAYGIIEYVGSSFFDGLFGIPTFRFVEMRAIPVHYIDTSR